MTENACDRFNKLLKNSKPGTTVILEDDLFECKPDEEVLRGKNVSVVEFDCMAPFNRDPQRTSWVKNRIIVTAGTGKYDIDHRCF